MDATLMLRTAAWLFVLTALGGLTMAGIRFVSQRNPPVWLSMAHGFAAGAGATLLAYAVATAVVPGSAKAALALFVVAAGGGVLMALRFLWWLLGAVVFPAWLLSGAADYLCHARTDIAHTSGRHEAALHLLQLAELGFPLLAFLFLEVDALVLALLLAGVVAHTLSAWRDLRYTTH